MRLMPVTVTVLLFLPGAGYAATPAGVVLGGECRQIDPKQTGFTCTLRRQGLALRWIEKQSAMPAERQERSMYEFNKIILRYFELGGRAFEVTADFWPAAAKRTCYALKPSYRTYTCVDEKSSQAQ